MKYWILGIDSAVGILNDTMANKEIAYSCKNAVLVHKSDLLLGYICSPVDEIRMILEATKDAGDTMLYIEKKLDVSKGIKVSETTKEKIITLNPGDNPLIEITEEEYTELSSALKESIYHQEKSETDESDSDKKSVTADKRTKGGLNRIFYGAPGCGKSYFVRKIIEDAGVKKDKIIRVTFHPEYANCDFIGQILPTIETVNREDGTTEDKVKYIFNPGPLTLALKTAYNTADMVYFIIEEINRGNAAAIFGDMFQLLDRVRDGENYGESEYPVCNPNMQDWLIGEATDETVRQKLEEGVYIPSNLTIFATMNSSDQNVFTLDTAFKRRWSFEQISNSFTDKDKKLRDLYVPGTDVTWEKFLTGLNKKILDNKIHNQTNEDKRLGKYFVTEDCLTENIEEIANVMDTASAFAYKVLEYLWNDVCKIGREDWFDIKSYPTLEDLINAFLNPSEEETPLSIFKD